MIRIYTNNFDIVVLKDCRVINRFTPADKSILKDIFYFNSNGFEHEMKNFRTFPELIKYCRYYA